MNFEQLSEPQILRKEITPLGPEVEVKVKGHIHVIREYKGKFTIVSSRSLTTTFDELPPAAIRLIEKAFSELTEQA